MPPNNPQTLTPTPSYTPPHQGLPAGSLPCVQPGVGTGILHQAPPQPTTSTPPTYNVTPQQAQPARPKPATRKPAPEKPPSLRRPLIRTTAPDFEDRMQRQVDSQMLQSKTQEMLDKITKSLQQPTPSVPAPQPAQHSIQPPMAVPGNLEPSRCPHPAGLHVYHLTYVVPLHHHRHRDPDHDDLADDPGPAHVHLQVLDLTDIHGPEPLLRQRSKPHHPKERRTPSPMAVADHLLMIPHILVTAMTERRSRAAVLDTARKFPFGLSSTPEHSKSTIQYQ